MNKGVCANCDKSGYFTSYPRGASEIECPFCNEIFSYLEEYGKRRNSVQIEYVLKGAKLNNNIVYCYDCHNIYMPGCTHAHNGCSEDIDNAVTFLIGDKRPTFESFEEFKEVTKDKKLYGTCNCFNENSRCSKESYKENFQRCNINNMEIYGKY